MTSEVSHGPAFNRATRGEAKLHSELKVRLVKIYRTRAVVGRKYTSSGSRTPFQCSAQAVRLCAVIRLCLGDANARMALTCNTCLVCSQQVVDGRHPFSGNHIMYSAVPDAMSRRNLSDVRTVAEHDSTG
jgi:hypothetical protein